MSFLLCIKALLRETEPLRGSKFAILWNVSRQQSEDLQAYRARIAGLGKLVNPKFAAANKREQITTNNSSCVSSPIDYQSFC